MRYVLALILEVTLAAPMKYISTTQSKSSPGYLVNADAPQLLRSVVRRRLGPANG